MHRPHEYIPDIQPLITELDKDSVYSARRNIKFIYIRTASKVGIPYLELTQIYIYKSL